MHIMKRFFDALEEQGVRCAHFKSNVNLADSFERGGDFDVVFDPAGQRQLVETLISLGAKQMNTTPDKRYPGVDNWLLFDPETGEIHHLHLHYQIMSGKQYVKDYEIPWRELILQRRVTDPKWQIPVTDPALELCLLNVRAVIKSKASDTLRSLVGAYRMHSSLDSERRALLGMVDPNAVGGYIDELFDSADAPALKALFCKEKLSGADFLRMSAAVRRSLRLYRRCSGLTASWLSTCRTLNYYRKRLIRKLGGFVNLRKTSMSKGAIIAFVGVDGSGKSTTAKNIYKWMYRQFDCAKVYMGLGDGKTTPLAALLKKGRSVAGPAKGEQSINSADYVKKEAASFWKRPGFYLRKRLLIAALWSVEKSNYRKMRAMNRFRINGGVSILDRYPQIELPNKNDGPKIEAYRGVIKADALIDRMVRKEAEKLSIVKTVKPDIIFRLNITAEESMRRKDDQTDITVVQGKIDDLRSITFQGARIVDIDAAQPYEQELLAIKKIIWDYL